MKNLSKDSQCPNQNLNRSPPKYEYKSEALLHKPPSLAGIAITQHNTYFVITWELPENRLATYMAKTVNPYVKWGSTGLYFTNEEPTHIIISLVGFEVLTAIVLKSTIF
jgi:hypothetical protein